MSRYLEFICKVSKKSNHIYEGRQSEGKIVHATIVKLDQRPERRAIDSSNDNYSI